MAMRGSPLTRRHCEIRIGADAFIAAYNETAEPFAWAKKKVYQRRFKNRRITQV